MKKSTTTKKTKKTKPVFVVDATNCETAFDLLVEFGKAKQKAGLPITDEELDAIIEDSSILCFIDRIELCACPERKKESWFKRMGKKLKRIFTW